MTPINPSEFLEQLEAKLATFDKAGAAALCKTLVEYLFGSDADFPAKDAEKILQQLRNKRMFDVMQRVADALIQTGRASFKIRRQYAQALIDGGGNITAALAVLGALIADTMADDVRDQPGARTEYAEAKGIRGRAYKELYLKAQAAGQAHHAAFILSAIQSYYDVYAASPAERAWHGINVVALLWRAASDEAMLDEYPDYQDIAKAILETVEEKISEKKADAWDYAIAAEACLALQRLENAEVWTAHYAADNKCDAFELASTLRQLEEVWRLDLTSEAGKRILPILRTTLLQREGGSIVLSAGEIQLQKTQDRQAPAVVYEKNFSNNVYIDFRAYKRGYECCEAVARIGRGEMRGDGTGFLMRGSALHSGWNDDLVLLTNAHVVSNEPAVQLQHDALQPEEAVIVFEALNRDEEFRVGSVLWSSPPTDLDVTIIAFDPADKERLAALTKNVLLYQIARVLPVANGRQRIYVIGHPGGGTLQFSMQDNILLDHQDPRIHYRTPTEGGNSGSPIFNQLWELLGIHHAGSAEMPCLNGNPGCYEANEGIWIQTIKKALQVAIPLPAVTAGG